MASVQLCLLVDLGEIMFFVRIVLLLFLPSFSVSENVDTSLGREKGPVSHLRGITKRSIS